MSESSRAPRQLPPSPAKREARSAKREALGVTGLFSDLEGERMRRGFMPRDMDDRWLIQFEDGWLNFRRSWTGHHIFAVRLDGSPNGVRIVDSWVTRDREQYQWQDIEEDRRLVLQMISHYFGDEAGVR